MMQNVQRNASLAALVMATQLAFSSRAADPTPVNFQVRPEGGNTARVFIEGELAQQNGLQFYGLDKASNKWVLIRDSFSNGTTFIFEFTVEGANKYSDFKLAATLPKPPNTLELVRTQVPGQLAINYYNVDPGTTIETVTFQGEKGKVLRAVVDGGSGTIPVSADDVARGYCLNTAPKLVAKGREITAMGIRAGDKVQVTSAPITENPEWKTVVVGDGVTFTYVLENDPSKSSQLVRIQPAN